MRRMLQTRKPQTVWDFMNEMNSVFDEAFPAHRRWGEVTAEFQPAVDVEETSDYYLMSFDLPGIDKEAIKVDLSENTLTVSGERVRENKTENEDGYKKFERSYGRFERRFQLPHQINGDKIQARHENGVLEVMVPKAEASKAKSIQVESGGNLFSRLLGKSDSSRKEEH